jgi:hypothetical protein
LTTLDWSVRLIEYGRLREYAAAVSVEKPDESEIRVVPVNRDAPVPLHDDVVEMYNRLRPRLIRGKPVVPVSSLDEKLWGTVGVNRPKKQEG